MAGWVPGVINGGVVLSGPQTDGTHGQSLVTDGNGNLKFASISPEAAEEVMEDHLEAENPHPQYALADLTTADIDDSSGRRYVTDAQREVLESTSGINTGDQDLSGFASITHEHVLSDITDAQATLDLKADLVDGVLPTSQLPALAIVEFLGSVDSEEEMLGLTGQQGDWCIRTDLQLAFFLIADDASALESWQQITTPGSPVLSVNSQTGDIVLGHADVGAAAASHTHTISNITNLQSSLDAKAPLAAPNLTGTVNVTAPGTAAMHIVRTGALSNFTMPGGTSLSVSSTVSSVAGVAAAMVSGNASQCYLYLGDTDNPSAGGFIYDNSNDTLQMRAGGSARASVASTVSTFSTDIQCLNLRVRGASGINIGNSTVDATAKTARVMMPSFSVASNPFCLLVGLAQSSQNIAVFGGGVSDAYAATIHRFICAANTTTTTGATVVEFQFGRAVFSVPVALPSHTVANSPSASTAGDGALIYCSDGDSGSPCLAVSSAGSWKRIALGSAISAT